MRLSSAALGLVLGAACAGLIACAAARPASTAPVVAPQTHGGPLDDPGHAEIAELDSKIAAARDRLGLPPGPATGPIAPVAPVAPNSMSATPIGSGSDPTCHPSPRAACHDTCVLSDDICGNAARICELAAQLPGDGWAAGKCSAGQASCTAAHARCCGCT